MADDIRVMQMRDKVAVLVGQTGIDWDAGDAPIRLLIDAVNDALSVMQSREYANQVWIPGPAEDLYYDSVASSIRLIDNISPTPGPKVYVYGSSTALTETQDYVLFNSEDDPPGCWTRMGRLLNGRPVNWDYLSPLGLHGRQIRVHAVRGVATTMPGQIRQIWEGLSVRFLKRSLAQWGATSGTRLNGLSDIPMGDSDLVAPLFVIRRDPPRQASWAGRW